MMVDIEELEKAIDYADVFGIGFQLFPERLIIDTRASDEQAPMIRVVEPLDSIPARYFWLGKERPSFGPPERFMFVPWPHSLRYLEESGILKRIQNSLTATNAAMADRCAAVFANLRELEHGGLVEAIHGHDRYRTLWSTRR